MDTGTVPTQPQYGQFLSPAHALLQLSGKFSAPLPSLLAYNQGKCLIIMWRIFRPTTTKWGISRPIAISTRTTTKGNFYLLAWVS